MTKISKKMPIAELGALVCESLKKEGIDAFLSGGAVVSIYTNNLYESFDLDFVSLADRTKIKKVMESLGFLQDRSRLYRHQDSLYLVEFPGSAVQIGDQPIEKFAKLKLKNGILKLLTPTDCVKDRLAAFYYWNDQQGLDQACWVANAHPVKLKEVERWSKKERQMEKFKVFSERMKP